MVKKQFHAEYSAPSIEVLDVVSESVFCTSSIGIYDWEEDEEGLDF